MVSNPSAAAIHRRMKARGKPARAKAAQWYFKTGPGEYAEGDRFLGLDVPTLRSLAREYQLLPMPTVATLLESRWHEERLLALLILVHQYATGTPATQRAIYRLYVGSTRYINNWDLVDSSAGQIVGAHIADRSRSPLVRLARSRDLWKRRIAMIATSHYIKDGDFRDTLRIAGLLVNDEHDLIHKAVGWMLREVGNRDRPAEESFLRAHAEHMPRTMLRYAVERFPAGLRRKYLAHRDRDVRRGT